MATKNTLLKEKKKRTTRPFEKAREALEILFTTSKKLSPSEMETLEILMDQELVDQINKGLEDIKAGRVSPIESIL